jgi:hypothetical protein
METKVRVTIKTLTQDIQFGYWDEQRQVFVPIQGMTSDERKAAAAKLGISELLLEALQMLGQRMADEVSADLRSIWQRLDRIEGK